MGGERVALGVAVAAPPDAQVAMAARVEPAGPAAMARVVLVTPAGTMQAGTMQGGMTQGGTTPGGTMPGGTMQGGTMQGGTMQGGTMQAGMM